MLETGAKLNKSKMIMWATLVFQTYIGFILLRYYFCSLPKWMFKSTDTDI